MSWLAKLNEKFGSKKVSALLVVTVAAILVVILTGDWNMTATTIKPEVTLPNSERELEKIESNLENKIAGVLQNMEGVGKVTVALSLSAGPRSEYGTNQTHATTVQEETPKDGGKRTQNQTNDNVTMVLAGAQSGGGSQPVRLVELSPQISGVLVVAEGAKNPYVLERIQRSVQTLLGIPAAKVRVEPSTKGE